jgi:two-component system sensor histidine kinase FlrB
MADLVSAFELFAGASTAIEKQHAELNRHLDQLRQDLMEANERLSVLIKALPAAVLLVERGLITHFNDAAAKLIPQLRTQTQWLLPSAWIPGDGPNEYRTTQGASARTLQLQQNHSEGRVVIQIQDITDNLRTLEESERVDRLAAMGKMSAGIAHQLRTPLSTALLYASHLSNPQLDLQDRTDFSQRLQHQLLNLEKLAGQMLQFIQPGLQQTHLLDINDLVREAVEQVQGLYLRQQLTTTLDLHTEPCLVEAERPTLVAALVAILENAAQASRAEQGVVITTRRQGQRVEVTIDDQGPGIAPDMLNNLFEPFATNRVAGTGLGLAIASSAIRRHRGDISANNLPDGGARFKIALPCLTHFEETP